MTTLPASVAARELRVADTDLFFSITDAKGVIRSGNRVFERISGYPLTELVGRAHNVVRHPSMPRAVFRVMWETIAAGEPAAAYVCNRAADGGFYWVMATIVPIEDGYLSVRTAPGGPHFAIAKEVYEKLHALEQAVEGGDVRRRKASIEASVDRLGELLAEAGFADYGAFMRAALPTEVIARAGRLPAGYRAALAEQPGDDDLAGVADACTALRGYLDGLVVNLTGYAATSRELAARSGSLQRLSDDVRLFSLNAQLGAARLDERGRALSAVAHLLSDHSQRSGPAMAELGVAAARAVADIETMVFRVAVSAVQAEMLAVFAHELTTGDVHDATADMAALMAALADGLERTGAALTGVGDRLAALTPEIRAVLGDVDLLGRLALNGSIEVARVPEATATGELFHEVRDEVERTRVELAGMLAVGDIVRDLRAAARDPRAGALAAVAR